MRHSARWDVCGVRLVVRTNIYTPSPCCNAPGQFTPHLNLLSNGDKPFDWLRCITLTLLVVMGLQFFLFTPTFSGSQLGRKTRTGSTVSEYQASVNVYLKPAILWHVAYCWLIAGYRSFGTAYGHVFKRLKNDPWMWELLTTNAA
jgi:hypothetical protein